MIGAFVGLSLAIAQALQLDRPYWVPVSCLAVIQGVSLRAVWNRQLQRVLGTAIGMLLAWSLLSLPLDPWRIALLVILLVFVIESLVVRHYGLAVIFITPLTILLAEAATLGAAPLAELIAVALHRHPARLRRRPGGRHLPAQPALPRGGGRTDAQAGAQASRALSLHGGGGLAAQTAGFSSTTPRAQAPDPRAGARDAGHAAPAARRTTPRRPPAAARGRSRARPRPARRACPGP